MLETLNLYTHASTTVPIDTNNFGQCPSILHLSATFFLSFKFQTHGHLCTVDVHINCFENTVSILNLVAISVPLARFMPRTPEIFVLET